MTQASETHNERGDFDTDLPETAREDERAMVLLVDDQSFVAEAIRRALVDEPAIDLHYLADPHRAVETARSTGATVILQDLVMPDIDGLTLVRRYREDRQTRNIPIIVLSTKEEAAVKSAAFAAGANDYLVKLPDAIELVARIRYHSRSYRNRLERDAAYRALRQSQQRLLETNLELQRLTHSDGLTGLSNRRYFDEYLAAEWQRAQRERRQLGLLMLDVDAFKAYNDTYEHVAGDEALKQVAGVLREVCQRGPALPARFGGEEFAVVLPGASELGARLVAEKVRLAVRDMALEHSSSPTAPVLTVSIGVAASLPEGAAPATCLVEQADGALYRAKREGKDRVGV